MIKLILIILTMILNVYAKNDTTGNFKFKPIGYASYQGGLVKSGTYLYENDINDYWYQKVFANLGFKKRINHWLLVTAAVELNMRLSYKSGNTFPESEVYSTQYYIDEARGDLYLIDKKQVRLGLTLGYFRFSYNPDVHNLGNNLLRSYSYPTVILSPEFDFPCSRLCGLDLHSSFFNDMIFNDLLATIHTDFYPVNDLSVSDIIGFYWRGFRLLFGVQFDRILEMSSRRTNRKFEIMYNPFNYRDSSGPITYSFASTKIMACFNLDLKKAFYGEDYPSIFGENDFKAFFEINILGLKNYPYFYEDRKDRTPINIGFMFPTFNLLDVLSIEYEYFGSYYRNSHVMVMNNDMPFTDLYNYNENYIYKGNDRKWSVYAKKSFSSFSIIFQVAHDHLQLWSIRGVDRIYRDNLIEEDDIYYQLKFRFDL